MTALTMTEADVEQAAIEWLGGLGWQVAHGAEIALRIARARR